MDRTTGSAATSAAALDAWRREVSRLVGRPDGPLALTRESHDRIPIRPLYVANDAPSHIEDPGQPPFTRGGTRVARQVETGWDIRSIVDQADPAIANRLIKEELAGGARSVHLVVANPFDTRRGTVVVDLAGLETLLEGIDITRTPLAIDARGRGAATAALFAAFAQRHRLPPERWRLAFDLDPLGASAGGAALDLDASIARSAAATSYLLAQGFTGTVLRADGSVYHAGGASSAQELACTMATAVAYLRALERVGHPPGQIVPTIAFRLGVDCDIFTNIAKFRAARRLWHRIANACGGDAGDMCIDAMAGRRIYARREAEVNILRATTMCVAAVAGGAAAITLLPFDSLIDGGSPLGRRAVRNIQLICMQESHLHRVVDPAGGSYQLETMTTNLGQEAWSIFQMIEGGGGMASMLTRGSIQDWIGESGDARMRAVATGRDAITGISLYADLDDKPPAHAAAAADQDLCRRAREQLERAPEIGEGDFPQQIALALTGYAVRHRPVLEAITDIIERRLAADFERLRDTSDAILDATGNRPALSAVSLGDAKLASQQLAFAADWLAAGGLTLNTGSQTGWGKPLVVLVCDGGAGDELIDEAAERARADGALEVWGMRPHPILDRVLTGTADRVRMLEEALDLLRPEASHA